MYTLPYLDATLRQPMQDAETSIWKAICLLGIFAIVSFIHSITFYHTLRHLPGGSTSAAVFKGLQAVLVFVLTDLIYCGRVGGAEMCFTFTKFVSLLTVAGGVLWYGYATSKITKKDGSHGRDDDSYNAIDNSPAIEIEPVLI